MPINPERLRRLRKGRNLSRAKLSERARMSERTIRRLESDSEASEKPHELTLERLAGALRVEEGVLTGELPFPDLDESATPEPVQIGAKIDPMARLAYDFIKRHYGVSATEIIDMAPLFFVLLAEGSLAQRRERMKETYEAIDHLERIWQSTDDASPYFNVAANTQEVTEWIELEEASIRKTDLFGEGLLSDSKNPWIADPFDPYDTNPFADYLRGLADALDKRSVVFCLQTGLLGSPPRFPFYRICDGMIEAIANGSYEALRALTSGAVRLDDIPEELMAEGTGEARAEWLADRAPTFDMDVDALLSAIEEDHLSEAGDRDDAESGERKDDR